MGLSIHYSGSIRDYSLVELLTDELQDICQSLNWSYHIWKNKKSRAVTLTNHSIHDIKGISFFPEGCESIFLTFLPNRKLISPIKLLIEDVDHEVLMPYIVSTKTQYAGLDAHIALIKLLRYLKDKYFDKLNLQDEGLYWETQDERILNLQFEKYEYAINVVTSALSDIKAIPGETAESLATRIEKLLKARK